ncbi:MAG TPA: GDSL-type esterase/lipase family protein [Candidatus Fimivivens sp.]|nr:GDSL-type esterase/lipase family protein [Candidatus Fimivivens sp.]
MPNIFIVGDSVVYGKWDAEGGWAARLRKYVDLHYNIGKGNNIQVHVLGIPSETVPRLAERLRNELFVRIDPTGKNLLMLSSGLNDSCPNNKTTGTLTPPEAFKDAYGKLIETGKELGCTVISLGLTPVNPERSKGLLFSNELVAEYDGYISEVCSEKGMAKLELFDTLTEENFADRFVDSAHPDSVGHERLFTLVRDYLEKEGMIEGFVSEDE